MHLLCVFMVCENLWFHNSEGHIFNSSYYYYYKQQHCLFIGNKCNLTSDMELVPQEEILSFMVNIIYVKFLSS